MLRPSTNAHAALEAVADGVRVAVRLTPKASRAGVADRAADADGRASVKLRVTAPANTKEWGLARSSLRIASGKKERIKSILVAGDPPVLLEILERWIEDIKHA